MAKVSQDTIEKVRQDYVQGVVDEAEQRIYPTIEDLSTKYKIPAITLYRKSKKEAWKIQKQNFIESLQAEIDVAKQKQIANQAKEFDADNLKIAKALQNEIVALLSLSNQRRRGGEQPLFNPSNLQSLGMALQTAQKVGRLALGETTENTTITTKQSTVQETFELIDEIIKSRGTGKPKVH